ncbi:hypothetical protein KDJ56_07195 [Brevibacillus composti]|uniref:Uncharacterized protein n=1 Tax=Brevibacillus composti TaxID=2796470 RepID=A0A7T5ENB2_9BACL|nr:hypothetical protein [Brevibacillus composti]QQE75716.1 hypothetical protein JD108_07515 [Brevibacillus composti]QUO42742.1 hypothetical protein KDJ56_07195 [Brevibacillus composti]
MTAFRDFLETDISTFLNPSEFGDIRNVDGKDITVVIDEDLTEERPRQPSELYYSADGVYKKRIVLYVRSVDFGPRPNIEDKIRVDGQLYLVTDCSEQMGILAITMEVYQP